MLTVKCAMTAGQINWAYKHAKQNKITIEDCLDTINAQAEVIDNYKDALLQAKNKIKELTNADKDRSESKDQTE